MTVAALTSGFAHPPLGAQLVFRLVLAAMARPGSVMTLDEEAPSAPPPLDDASFALALTLLDFETPVWLDAELATPDVIDGLRFHCGCPIVEQPSTAAFALLGDAAHMPELEAFCQGTVEYPDRAATLIIQTEGIADDDGWTLSGPGIESRTRLRVLGLPAAMVEWLHANRHGFPNGVDLIFTHGRQLACLPRTTKLEA